MKKYFIPILISASMFSCQNNNEENKEGSEKNKKETQENASKDSDGFKYSADRFADIEVLRYRIPNFDKLSLQQKKLAYYLSKAGLSGRDIIYDQNYEHNLAIRNTLERIVEKYEGKKTKNWDKFMTYVKQVWFANGIHHHYSMDKFHPEFNKSYFKELLSQTGTALSEKIINIMFDKKTDMKRVNKDESKGLIEGSANNFYGKGITAQMVDDYYNKKADPNNKTPVSHGLNSKLVLSDEGDLKEKVWKVGGMYSAPIKRIIYWLEKAVEVAENEKQADALKLLIEYYKTGSLKTWDDYSVAWVEATEGEIDYINGFIEVYGDSKGYRATYETIVQMKNFEASERMSVVQENTQWFEDHSPIMDKHKKENVKGVTYKVVNVVSEAGDASPATPIGVNLPNASWIRKNHGSKSVSLGNIVSAYEKASGGSVTEEFAHDEEEVKRSKKYSLKADKLHTALHEVVGHASGKIEEGVGTTKQTLKNYASTLEEGRADLVALYYLMDKKLIDIGLMDTLAVGKAAYDSYIRNGMMIQLKRLKPGSVIEEAHMRNRQLVAKWVYEKGKKDNVISKVQKDGKTYFEINDYKKLQDLFGQLMREIQRIKSQGDFEAGKKLVENYGVQVDQALHQEVLKRVEPLNIASYQGFINPHLKAEKDKNGEITDIKVSYPTSFKKQMLNYSEEYSFLKP